MAATSPEITVPPIVDVGELIETQRPGWILFRLVLICWLVTFFDGFDTNSIAFAAPYLAKAYSFDKHALTAVFAWGGAGTLFGGFLFGALGDHIGRRRAVISATLCFSILTLLLSLSDRYWELLAVRFLNGVALGGALPITWALGVEYVPTRYRATVVTLIMLGYGIGVATAGPISVALLPRFGWQSIFVFGGAASVLTTLALALVLPESLRFLAARRADTARLASVVRWLDPQRHDPAGTRCILASIQPLDSKQSWGPAPLFSGQLGQITPLLWLGYISSSMIAFFFTSWGPIVFEEMGLSRNTAAWAVSFNSLAGAIGGVSLMRFTDRVGVISIAVMPAISVPALLVIGLAPIAPMTAVITMGLLYIFLGGSHYGIISIAGTFYPTSHRALGTGWMSGIGKSGSIFAPALGGMLLTSGMPVQRIFAILAIFPAIFAVCGLAIGLLERAGKVRAAP
jgi:AAHS family 4-hydroxybenzoate transporter-like MFS transporter